MADKPIEEQAMEITKKVVERIFQPLKWVRVHFKPVPLSLDVHVTDIDEAEKVARCQWIEIANCPIVDSIEELEENNHTDAPVWNDRDIDEEDR